MAKRRLVVEVDCEDAHCGRCGLNGDYKDYCQVYRCPLDIDVGDVPERCPACLAAEVKEPEHG